MATNTCPEPATRPDLWPTNTCRDANGVLSIGGVALNRETLGDALTGHQPVIVLDEAALRGRAEVWRAAMEEACWSGYGMAGAQVYYAGKAFLCGKLVQTLSELGLGIDTASLGELTLALRAGANPANVGLHGNAKTDAELHLAISNNIGRIIVDNEDEIARIAAISRHYDTRANVMVRVTTGVHAGGHQYIATAHEDQKFGLSLTTGAAERAARTIAHTPELRLVGLHSHIGSQITDLQGFALAAKKLCQLRHRLIEADIAVPELDLGGGYAIAYTGADPTPLRAKDVADVLAKQVRESCAASGDDVPKLSIEPGRSIAGPVMVTCYPVIATKDVTIAEGKTRRYVAVDGGMSDNIRPVLYQASYTATLANRPAKAPTCASRVVGKHCESGDILIADIDLPADVTAGDLLVMPATGAYGRSMASNYNLALRPGVLAVNAGASSWWVRPETLTDLFATDTALGDA
ncbi:MAG: diaminopimelate decarboxylase [Bowdeniella nasicola]|nr:diaminopimelate decarboxylase [Bowdeniella nasicola]